MLKEIKSTYFHKYVYTFINEKTKLYLVRYNKSLQNILNISLINYEIFSGKYIIKESKDKWKIYNSFSDELIFEGNYINGWGIEFYNNGLMFVGLYLNGKKNWIRIELKHSKKIIEGEYLNGKRWNVKQFDEYNYLHIIIGLKDGNGYLKRCINFDNSGLYEGEFLNREKNGKGKDYYFSGNLKF